LKVASKEEKDIEFTKRAKLAELAGLPTEVKKAQRVPKDTNFSLWLNVARSRA
jgi:hypothetical protein